MNRKQLFASFLAATLIFSQVFALPQANAAPLSWYVKRNGTRQPIFSAEQACVTEYNAYYLDTHVSDTSDDKVIYLTFDAGYENGNVAKILDALRDENVPAAFFVLDNIVLKNPDLVNRMNREGHTVCNHTKNHKNISNYTKDEIRADLEALEQIYEQQTQKKLSKYFRFPEGKYSINALKSLSELGYKTIFWSFAYDDWNDCKQYSDERALNKVLSNTHNGAVMLFHPTSKTNAKIFPTLIKEWKKMGYRFATLDELTAK